MSVALCIKSAQLERVLNDRHINTLWVIMPENPYSTSEEVRPLLCKMWKQNILATGEIHSIRKSISSKMKSAFYKSFVERTNSIIDLKEKRKLSVLDY